MGDDRIYDSDSPQQQVLDLRTVLPVSYTHLPRAVGAVRVVGGTGIDCRLPDMSLGAYPPDLPRTAIGDLLWRQRPILGRVPLSQQSRLTSLHAVVV